MPTNKQVLYRVIHQILGLPECDAGDIKVDMNDISLSDRGFVVKFRTPDSTSPLFVMKSNMVNTEIVFRDENVRRRIDVTDTGISDVDLGWVKKAIAYYVRTVREIATRVMTAEGAMQSERGEPYFEQFPKASPRQLLDQSYPSPELVDAVKNYLTVMGAYDEEAAEGILTDNRVALSRLVASGVSPADAVKYVFNSPTQIANIDPDDIVVSDRKTGESVTLGRSSGSRLSTLLDAPLNENTSCSVDIGYLQGGERPAMFYRLTIDGGKLALTRYTNPDEGGKVNTSSVKSTTALGDLDSLNEWIDSTIQSLYEVDYDIDNKPKGNLVVYFGENPPEKYPDDVAATMAAYRKAGHRVEMSANAGSTNLVSDVPVECKVADTADDNTDHAVVYLLGGTKLPVISIPVDGDTSHAGEGFIVVDDGAGTEMKYMTRVGRKTAYASESFNTVAGAVSFARKLVPAYKLVTDFDKGVRGLVRLLINSGAKDVEGANISHIDPSNYYTDSKIDKVGDNVKVVMTLFSTISDKTMVFDAIVSDVEGGVKVDFMYRPAAASTPVEVKLGDESVAQALTDPSNGSFNDIIKTMIPVLASSMYGNKPTQSEIAKNTAQAELERRRRNSLVAEPEVDKSDAIAKIGACRTAFDNTFGPMVEQLRDKSGEGAYADVTYKLSQNYVSRNDDGNIVSVSFNVDNGESGNFFTMQKADEAGKRLDESVVVCQVEGNANSYVSYENGRLSPKFVEWFLSKPGKLQSAIARARRHAEEPPAEPDTSLIYRDGPEDED